jgi:hypothetical protein
MDKEKCSYSFYIFFIIIYIISFSALYNKNSEVIGILLLFFINIIASIFCGRDLYDFLNNSNPQILLILGIIFCFNIVSSTLFLTAIMRIYTFTKNKGSDKLIVSKTNRKMIERFKSLFISVIVGLWVFLFLLFFLPKDQPIINLDKIFNTFEMFKILLVLYPLAVSCYLIYSSNKLMLITRHLK